MRRVSSRPAGVAAALAAMAASWCSPAFTLPQGYICAEGGGFPTSQGWGASVFGWMVSNAPGGDVVVLGVGGGADTAAASAFIGAGASTVTQVLAPAGSAGSPAVAQAIAAADIVWIRGGDQAEYVAAWQGTATEAAIRSVYQSGGVVGGTSAGCAVLSGIVYDAVVGSLPSDALLSNPFDPRFTVTEDFLELGAGELDHAIFDTHFTERGRLARLAVQVARLRTDPVDGTLRDVTGFGVDDQTALCIYPDGTAEVLGAGSVTVLRADASSQQRVRAGEAPTIVSYAMDVLTEGYVVDVSTGAVLSRSSAATVPGTLSPEPSFEATRIRGDLDAHRRRADAWVDDGGDDFALFYGALELRQGEDLLRQTAVATRAWESTALDENLVGGTLWALARNPGWLGVLLDYESDLVARADGILEVEFAVSPPTAAMLIDTRALTSVAESTYVVSAASDGPRQSVALEGARLHVLAPGNAWGATGGGAAGVLGGEAVGTAKLASNGFRARLGWVGSPSLSMGSFGLEIEDAVPGQFTVLISGDQLVAAPYFGATRYFGGQILRHGLGSTAPDGTLAFPLVVTPALVGTTRVFQAVIRDPALGLPDPVTTTQGLQVTFVP